MAKHGFTISSETFSNGLLEVRGRRMADQFRWMWLTISGMATDVAYDIRHTLALLEAEIDWFLDRWQRD